MAVKLSTGLGTALMGATGIDVALNLGFIKIYSGTPPAGANDALGAAVLLLTISNNSTGTGLTLDTPVNGVIGKTPAEVWRGTGLATGSGIYGYEMPTVTFTYAGATPTEAHIQWQLRKFEWGGGCQRAVPVPYAGRIQQPDQLAEHHHDGDTRVQRVGGPGVRQLQ